MPATLLNSVRLQVDASSSSDNPWLGMLLALGLVAGSYMVARYFILGIVLRWLNDKKDKRLRIIASTRIPRLLTLLVPALVLYVFLPYFASQIANLPVDLIYRLLIVYDIVIFALLMAAALSALKSYYGSSEYAKTFPITSILEAVSVVLFLSATVLIVTVLLNVSLIYVIAILGALIAAATVVFNNLILAFFAGLILTSKKLIMIDDWIELPELRIDGLVQEVTLTTVIVRNRDHTIGTVPSAYLLSNSFKNWRGVKQDGARLIRWPIFFDLNSVMPAEKELLSQIRSLPNGATVLRTKTSAKPHGSHSQNALVSRIEDTNLSLFCDYLLVHLQNHPLMLSQELQSVYLDAPTKFGIPVQIMVSTNEIDYIRFLEIQTILLEDVLHLAGKFQLKVYQIEDRVALSQEVEG